jgi:DNA-binding transcriptional LysR family regulator
LEFAIRGRLPRFCALSDIELDISLVSVVDLVEEGYDLAVRIHAADHRPLSAASSRRRAM